MASYCESALLFISYGTAHFFQNTVQKKDTGSETAVKTPTMCNGQKGVAEISKNEQFNKHLEKDELVIFILLPPCCLLGTNGAVGRRGIVKKVVFVY